MHKKKPLINSFKVDVYSFYFKLRFISDLDKQNSTPENLLVF